jgi:hypothetical protein
MQFRSMIVAIAAMAIALAGCNSAQDASKSNFKAQINMAMAKDCVAVGPGINLGANTQSYPQPVSFVQPGFMMTQEAAKAANDRAMAPYEALVKAGLLSSKDADVPVFANSTNKVKGRIYDLTPEGQKYLIDPKRNDFCAAHLAVDEVTEFTEPGNALGVTVSMAKFTYGATDIAPWATNPDVQKVFSDLNKELGHGQQGTAEMDLTNNGWVAHPERTGML